MMARLHFDDQSKEVEFLFSSRCFIKETENIFSVFLSSYRNTRESWVELEKAVETFACRACVPAAFLVLPNFQLGFYNSIETLYIVCLQPVFFFSKGHLDARA